MNNGTKHRPPKWVDDFLERYCLPEFIDEIQGDLHEAFHKRCREKGLFYAKGLFVVDAFRSISFRTLQNPFYVPKNSVAMFSNYLIVGSRNLLRNKVFSIVNT
ncbi:MAG TPA: permease prefix domain 2-containing transporter, partial [Chryseolinea sp.]|nr:permease prefix domain 2-containing transporter [Chryseolinea sp.]